ncbi:hypothetical protein CAPTEDRAFT_195827 [Capitella teleta]|uniref:Uncharacterized protein n=1 Tax=Capitella teleta TaxID=283909 RepID=R7THM5_CAPTE|nr:hypothetical protein CAPTEDRAFT_195827 [Capitella teleta]|eukprot:ELT91071.1 hypothetical protein CAPTEDRAFT_195827 [Capitella teleta]
MIYYQRSLRERNSSANLETTLVWWQNHADARKCLPTMKQVLQKKKAALQHKLTEKLSSKQSLKEVQLEKTMTQKLKASRQVFLYGGPWMSDEVEDKLQEVPSADQKKALLARL